MSFIDTMATSKAHKKAKKHTKKVIRKHMRMNKITSAVVFNKSPAPFPKRYFTWLEMNANFVLPTTAFTLGTTRACQAGYSNIVYLSSIIAPYRTVAHRTIPVVPALSATEWAQVGGTSTVCDVQCPTGALNLIVQPTSTGGGYASAPYSRYRVHNTHLEVECTPQANGDEIDLAVAPVQMNNYTGVTASGALACYGTFEAMADGPSVKVFSFDANRGKASGYCKFNHKKILGQSKIQFNGDNNNYGDCGQWKQSAFTAPNDPLNIVAAQIFLQPKSSTAPANTVPLRMKIKYFVEFFSELGPPLTD